MNCIGVNYKKVPLEVRENYAFSEEEQREFHRLLREKCGAAGSVIVSTCNRSEIYFCGENAPFSGGRANQENKNTECAEPEEIREKVRSEYTNHTKPPQEKLIAAVEQELASYKDIPKEEVLSHIYVYSGEKALRHLFYVAGGLDSMVLGEDEILRQVKEGYMLALKNGMTCNELNIAFQGAMNSAKSIKTETLLSKTPVSMGTLAANRIEAHLKEHGGSRILIVGITGKIGSILAKNLYSKGLKNLVGTSRKHSGKTSDIVMERFLNMDIQMVDFKERYAYVNDADVIVSASASPHYTFTGQKTAAAMKTEKNRLFIDMAVPRDMDMDIAKLAGCSLIDIDDFKMMAGHNNEIKMKETDRAEMLLEEKLEETLKSIYMSEFMERKRGTFETLKDRTFGSVFYQLKERLSSEQLLALMEAMEKV